MIDTMRDMEKQILCKCLAFMRDQIFSPRQRGFNAESWMKGALDNLAVLEQSVRGLDGRYGAICANVLSQASIGLSQSCMLGIVRGNKFAYENLRDPLGILLSAWTALFGIDTILAAEPPYQGRANHPYAKLLPQTALELAIHEPASSMLSMLSLNKGGTPMPAAIIHDAKLRFSNVLSAARKAGNLRLYNVTAENLALSLFFAGEKFRAYAILQFVDSYFSTAYEGNQSNRVWQEVIGEWIGRPDLGNMHKDRFAWTSPIVGKLIDEGIRAKNIGDLSKAERCLTTAIAMDPYEPRAFNSLGNCRKRSDPQASLKDFDRAIYLMGGVYPEALFNKADSLSRMGNYKEAKRAMHEYLEYAPEDPDALVFLNKLERKDSP
jgi:tetratricopeptide (TPR) repeat protein